MDPSRQTRVRHTRSATEGPEVLAALHESGWHHYSLFLRESDGLVVGYLETDDFAQAMACMAATGVA
jgi:L-rhamnose mutarotase